MDREYLEDYQQREFAEFETCVLKRIERDEFDFRKERYPPDERFIKLQKPVSKPTLATITSGNLWTQIPFTGSLLVRIPSFPRSAFEKELFQISDIPKIIDFVKDTGRLQVVLTDSPASYVGLDYLDPFFEELNPPTLIPLPISTLENQKEMQKATDAFFTLGQISFLDNLRKACYEITSRAYKELLDRYLYNYLVLKLGRYAICEEIENSMIDNPQKAIVLFSVCSDFIVDPLVELRADLCSLSTEEIKRGHLLPLVFQLKDIRFPHEIGKFLLEKLTYAPYGLDACKQLIYNYEAYDLRKVQESLNDAIVLNHPDVVNKSAKELSEILDNIWRDPTIPRRVKGLKIGIPVSMAAIGTVAAGPIGAIGGFLAGLGFNVVEKLIETETTGISEGLAKLRTKSYQANVYDFKKEYKTKITRRNIKKKTSNAGK